MIAGFLLTSPLPQDPAYHQFADTRPWLAISNFWNVWSNLPFLVVGVWGLSFVYRQGRMLCLPGLAPAYVVFFSGVALTAFGSGYYHLAPANAPLVWDRLPMTIGFAGLFSIIVGEFLSVRAARWLLPLMLAVGIGSVLYWARSEALGVGDLRPYALVQFLPMLLIPIILLTRHPARGGRRYYWLMLFFYVLAKVAEYFDATIFGAGEVVSGHTLKHLFAAGTPATMLYALMQRRRLQRSPAND